MNIIIQFIKYLENGFYLYTKIIIISSLLIFKQISINIIFRYDLSHIILKIYKINNLI